MGYNDDIYAPPDQGFHHREILENELQNVAIFEAETSTTSIPTPNSFLDLEAIERPYEDISKYKKTAC